MTSLGYMIIMNKTTGKWLVTKEISGDLSFSYRVRPRSALMPDGGFVGVGIAANKLSDVDKIIKLCNKCGYSNAYDVWSKKMMGNYRFGYLRGKEAKKYAQVDGAYGDYAMKMKPTQKIMNKKVKKLKTSYIFEVKKLKDCLQYFDDYDVIKLDILKNIKKGNEVLDVLKISSKRKEMSVLIKKMRLFE